MKITMWLSSVALLAAGSFFHLAASAPVLGDGFLDSETQTSTPCSCDCCQVQKMLPMDIIAQPNGEQITSQCAKPAGQDSADSVCPMQCQPSNENRILAAAKGEVDYNRFCGYNCQPVTDSMGSACVQFNRKLSQQAAGEDSGNGVDVRPQPVLGLNSGLPVDPQASAQGGALGGSNARTAGAAGVTTKAETPAEQAKALAEASAAKLKVVYDMRTLVAERLRSETGAAVAAGAAAAERVRINEWSTKQNANLLKKLRVKLPQAAGKVEEGVVGVKANALAADEAERETKVALAASRISASKIVLETRRLTDEAIRAAVAPCTKQAAKDQAEAKGLDKPQDWVKVVAARAANPYQAAVTEAVSRTAEYKNVADHLMGQAQGAQQEANALVPHVNMLESQGDALGASIEKKQVSDLLSRANTLQGEAQGYWKTASETRETIPKWQMAAQQAAAYSAWEYSNNAKAFR